MTTIERLKADLDARERRGVAKYGVTVDQAPLSHRQWLEHAYEEALDFAVYLRRAMDEIDAAERAAEEERR